MCAGWGDVRVVEGYAARRRIPLRRTRNRFEAVAADQLAFRFAPTWVYSGKSAGL